MTEKESKYSHWKCTFCGLENIPVFETDLDKLKAVLEDMGIEYEVKEDYEDNWSIWIVIDRNFKFNKDGKLIK